MTNEERISRLRTHTTIPDVADLMQEARLLSLTDEGIAASLQAAGLENTPENREQMRMLICEELESTGTPSAFGLAKAREQHKALQKMRRCETGYTVETADGESVLLAAEQPAGTLYKTEGSWRVRNAASDASGKIINDLAEEALDHTQAVDPELLAMQQSALSDLSEQDRIWLWEYESHKRSASDPRSARDRQKASRLRRRVKRAVEEKVKV